VNVNKVNELHTLNNLNGKYMLYALLQQKILRIHGRKKQLINWQKLAESTCTILESSQKYTLARADLMMKQTAALW
jgi:hypothetical protein